MMDEQLLSAIEKYVDDHYENSTTVLSEEKGSYQIPGVIINANKKSDRKTDRVVKRYMNSHGESFSQMLNRLMKEHGMTASELSKRSNIDRRTISKINTIENYRPTVETIAYLALALQLSLEQTNDLLKSAGRAFTNTDLFDVVVSACILFGVYDLDDVEAAIAKCAKSHPDTD